MTSISQAAQAPFDPSASQGGGTAALPTGSLGKEDFLKLLVTQLGQQDPLNPSDATEFVTQLSQFTSLEQLVNIKDGLDVLAITQTAGTSAQVVSFIGKEVAYANDVVTRDGPAAPPSTLSYKLDGKAADVQVEIRDDKGLLVKTIDAGAQPAGPAQLTWDGRDDNGVALPAGDYTFKVVASDASGAPVDVETRATRRVTAIRFENGYPQLVLESGETISLGQVLEVIEGEAETAAAVVAADVDPQAAPDSETDATSGGDDPELLDNDIF